MSPFHKKIGLLIGFALLIVLVLTNAAITRRQLGVQLQKRSLVGHSRKTLLEISQTVSFLKDAETAQRGYLYTNSREYLDPYNHAVSVIPGHLQELDKLTASDPEQNARAKRLHDLTGLKLAELAETIELNKSGHGTEARALVLTNLGKNTMEKIRALASEMWDAESAAEADQEAEYHQSTRLTIASIYLTSAAAILALLLLAYYLLHNLQERERHAAILREREQWFRVTLGSIGDGVIATDAAGKVTFLNPVAESLMGIKFANAINKPVHEVFPIFNEVTNAPVDNPVAKVLQHGKIVGLANHTVLKHRDGRLIPIEDSAAPIVNDQHQTIGVVLVFRDATANRHSQEVIRRAEKLAAAGRLAATMAHEINNPLEAVGNLIFLARGAQQLSQEALDYLEQAEGQLERVSHITRQTLGFYRESSGATEVSMLGIIESVLRLYDNKLKDKGIAVERNFDHCPSIYGLAGELRQMVANLVSNALDAMPDNGKLSITIGPVQRNGVPGVEIRVKDTGVGIPQENLDRIFEPFFTTKEDIGTGLGLWVTRQLAEHHGGTISVESKCEGPDRGSLFSVFLPEKNATRASSAGE